ARIRIQPPRGQADCQLVGVRDAVPTATEYVFAEGLRKAEIGVGGIEDRQLGLVTIRYVQVIDPRLQRVDGSVAEQRGVTLESHAGIHAENGQRTRLRASTASVLREFVRIPVHAVLAQVQPCLRRDVPACPDDGVGDRGVGSKAV